MKIKSLEELKLSKVGAASMLVQMPHEILELGLLDGIMVDRRAEFKLRDEILFVSFRFAAT